MSDHLLGIIAAHSAYGVFSWSEYLIVNLLFFHTSIFGVGIIFLIAPFPDHCLLLPSKVLIVLCLGVNFCAVCTVCALSYIE